MRAGVLPMLFPYSLPKRNKDVLVDHEDREIALDEDMIINIVDCLTKNIFEL